MSFNTYVESKGPGFVTFKTSLKDEFWGQLLNKGIICGDERWLIGENGGGDIVVLHFDERRNGERRVVKVLRPG